MTVAFAVLVFRAILTAGRRESYRDCQRAILEAVESDTGGIVQPGGWKWTAKKRSIPAWPRFL